MPGIAVPVFYGVTAANVFIAAIFYVVLGGYRMTLDANLQNVGGEAFTREQKICLAGLAALVVMVVIFRMDVGFVSFFLAFLLMLVGAADKKRPVKLVPWNVLILICGISVLMSVIKSRRDQTFGRPLGLPYDGRHGGRAHCCYGRFYELVQLGQRRCLSNPHSDPA